MDPKELSTLSTRRRFIGQMACAAVGTSALTNTIRDLRLMNVAMADTTITDYKALVCIFLAGGNDSNNLIIPTIPAEWQNYADIRSSVLAIPNTVPGSPATALALNTPGNDNNSTHTYGINPACPELASLFNAGKLATVFNVGTLVYPLNKTQYLSNSVAKPPQLFSHADQVTQWQTSIPDQPPVSGWGGRCADLLAGSPSFVNGNPPPLSLAISLAGSNTFEVGGVVQQYSVSTSGVTAVSSFTPAASARSTALNDILGIDKLHANLLVNNYAKALDQSIATGSALSTALGNSQMNAYWGSTNNWGNWSSLVATDAQVTTPNGGPTFTSDLMKQLRMVAKIIEAGLRRGPSDTPSGNGLGMKRQIFFVQLGGFDTHTNQTNASNATPTAQNVIIGSQADLLAQLSQCINKFQNALAAIGAQYGDSSFVNRVTTFTASDFGRTFPSNSLGSDHGWGSHHLVIGGAVQGGRTYGKWPALVVGGPDDTGTGRWLPTTAVDQFAGTLAKWFGVTPGSQMNTVFPNLVRFATPDLGFMG